MYAFENVQIAVSDINNFSVTTLNAMVEKIPFAKFFSRTTDKGTTVLVRAPKSFNKWLKTKTNYTALCNYGKGPALTVKKDPKFKGLFWREEKMKLYACYDGHTIPWSNWVTWCNKQHAKAMA